jgi:hypothetical protein
MTHREIGRAVHGDPGPEANESPPYLERAGWLARLRELSALRRDERATGSNRPAVETLGPAARAAPSMPRR